MNYEKIKNELKKYVDNIKNNTDMKNIIIERQKLIDLCKDDIYLMDNIDKITVDNVDYYSNLLITYLNEKISNSIEEVIGKTFGVDVSEIQHKLLDSGTEIFSFYDQNYRRTRVLENPKENISLMEQLKEIQNENINFQGEKDYKENSNEILKSEIENFKCELQLISIGEIDNYQYRIDKLEDEQRRKFNYLLKNKDIYEIQYINLENLIAVTKDNEIIESVLIKDTIDNTEKLKIESPKDYKYNYEQVDNKEKIDNTIKEVNDDLSNDNELEENLDNNKFEEFEDMPELIEAELLETKDTVSKEEIEIIKNNIIKYYNNPDLMINLPTEEREFYEKMINIISEKYEEKLEYNNQIKKTYRYDNTGKNNIYMISIITIIIACIIFLMIKLLQ